ncbi:hypothetical protein B0H13DRAFT_2394292 [Mycena leptocephala]|nr:hypothetical protein B0H13DRAFT_2394292 [Mycena leptocephala]
MLNTKFSALLVLILAAVVTGSPAKGPGLLAPLKRDVSTADPVDVDGIKILWQHRDDSASVLADEGNIRGGAEGLADGEFTSYRRDDSASVPANEGNIRGGAEGSADSVSEPTIELI